MTLPSQGDSPRGRFTARRVTYNRMTFSVVRRLWQIQRQLDGIRCDLPSCSPQPEGVAELIYGAESKLAAAADLMAPSVSAHYRRANG